MGKKPNIRNIKVLEDHSQDQSIAYVENNMYIEPARDQDEVAFWKNRLKMQGIPFVMAHVEHYTKDPVTMNNYVKKGTTFFVKEPKGHGG